MEKIVIMQARRGGKTAAMEALIKADTAAGKKVLVGMDKAAISKDRSEYVPILCKREWQGLGQTEILDNLHSAIEKIIEVKQKSFDQAVLKSIEKWVFLGKPDGFLFKVDDQTFSLKKSENGSIDLGIYMPINKPCIGFTSQFS